MIHQQSNTKGISQTLEKTGICPRQFPLNLEIATKNKKPAPKPVLAILSKSKSLISNVQD